MSTGIEQRGAIEIGELLQHHLGQRQSLLEPASVKGRLVEGDQAVDEEGVVFEVSAELCPAVLVGAQEAAVATEFAQEEIGVFRCRVSIIGSAEDAGSFGQCS